MGKGMRGGGGWKGNAGRGTMGGDRESDSVREMREGDYAERVGWRKGCVEAVVVRERTGMTKELETM